MKQTHWFYPHDLPGRERKQISSLFNVSLPFPHRLKVKKGNVPQSSTWRGGKKRQGESGVWRGERFQLTSSLFWNHNALEPGGNRLRGWESRIFFFLSSHASLATLNASTTAKTHLLYAHTFLFAWFTSYFDDGHFYSPQWAQQARILKVSGRGEKRGQKYPLLSIFGSVSLYETQNRLLNYFSYTCVAPYCNLILI